MSKTVNIVALKDGWILEEIAKNLSQKLDFVEWTEKPTGRARITYYINYAQARDKRLTDFECSLFTHLEERVEPLIQKWWDVASETDVAVCMSELYAKMLKKRRVNTIVIPPGVDIETYTLKPIRIGIVGRAKGTGRKGEELLRAVMDIDGIEWLFTGSSDWPGKASYLPANKMPEFYRSLDYVLIPSFYEGGPMCAIEALSTGVPIIAPPVGWVPELPHIPFKLGNAHSLRKVLQHIVDERTKLRQSVLNRTWDNFSLQHSLLFNELLQLSSPSKGALRKAVQRTNKQYKKELYGR